jgi:uncharacterized Zn-binding protein involved in type VI secretion
MAAVAKDGSICSGHGCWYPRTNTDSSSDVFIEGAGAVRVGDGYDIHICDEDAHPGTVESGSGSVFVNGQPLARIGDSINCGSVIAEGADTVFAGGSGGGGGFGVGSIVGSFF